MTGDANDPRPSVSVFSESWWLDAVSPGCWNEVLVESAGRIAARLPFVFTKRRGLGHVGMPPLTQHLGPSLRLTASKHAAQFREEKQLLEQLIKGLPRHDIFRQNFHHSVGNWLPFYWAGFAQSTNYTYVLPATESVEVLWSGFESRVRTDVRKAEKRLQVTTDGQVDQVWPLVRETYERVGRQPPYSQELMLRAHHEALQRGRSEVLFARDESQRLHAAAMFIWDAATSYYLLGGSTREGQASSASTLILWHAIQRAVERGTSFDFEGSMVESIERFFRGFGAKQLPYFHLTRKSKRAKLVGAVHDFARALRTNR